MVSKEALNDVYLDMKARIDMGLTDFDDADSFMMNLWEAIAEKLPEQYHPEVRGEIDAFSAFFGTVSERLIREHYGLDWW